MPKIRIFTEGENMPKIRTFTEEEKTAGSAGGLIVINSDGTYSPTNFGNASGLVREMQKKMLDLFEKGEKPTENDIDILLAHANGIVTYLRLHRKNAYALHKELW